MSHARPLTGCRAGISISVSEDLAERGFTEAAINRLTVRLTRTLLDEGAAVAFGHDWRDKGIMDAVCRAALDSFGFLVVNRSVAPLILNLIPWPDETTVGSETLDCLTDVLAVRRAKLPKELDGRFPPGLAQEDAENPLWRYVQSRGLTHLRRRLTAECQARICLGGKEHTFSGRYPGILEEALLALEAGLPLYLIGIFGGAAKSVGHAILDQKEPKSSDQPLADLYRRWEKEYPSALPQDGPRFAPLRDEVFDLQGAWKLLAEIGSTALQNNGLSEEENRRLLNTHLEDEALHLVVKGLRNVRSREGEENGQTS